MAVGAASVAEDQWISVRTFEWFIAFSMCGLGYLKIRDVESFSTMFLDDDLLARRWVPSIYIYSWAETGAGLLMIAAVLNVVAVPVALFIGSVGAASVVKVVYIDKRELECAWVGGSSSVHSASCPSRRTWPWSGRPSGWASHICSGAPGNGQFTSQISDDTSPDQLSVRSVVGTARVRRWRS